MAKSANINPSGYSTNFASDTIWDSSIAFSSMSSTSLACAKFSLNNIYLLPPFKVHITELLAPLGSSFFLFLELCPYSTSIRIKHFLLKTSVVFFNLKSNNKFFYVHFFSLMLKVFLKPFHPGSNFSIIVATWKVSLRIIPSTWISCKITWISYTWLIIFLESTIINSRNRPTTNFFVSASSILYFQSKDSHSSFSILNAQ